MAICNMKPVAGQFTTNVSVPNLILSLRPCLEKIPQLYPTWHQKRNMFVSCSRKRSGFFLWTSTYIHIQIFIYNIWVHNMTDKAKNCQTILEVIFPRFHSFTTSFPNIRAETRRNLCRFFVLQDTNEIQSSRKTLRFSNGNS